MARPARFKRSARSICPIACERRPRRSAGLNAAEFEKGRAADHYIALPLAGLAPGEYLLRAQAEMGTRIAGRALRFTVN
jgi:hypothetical protein